jgi:hypothetical protein
MMSRAGRFVALAPILGALFLAGCYTYVPVDTPTPGSMARVRIPLVTALSDPNAPPEVATVEGRVVQVGDTLLLAIETRREYGAFRNIIQFDTLRLGPDQIASIDYREFSSGKSVALGVGISVAVVAVALSAFGGGDGGGGLPGDPPPPVGAIVASRSLVSTIWSMISR